LGFAPEVLDWSVGRLSSGERQRLALVRMLEPAPKILLLDEPTANLDGDSRKRVEQLILDFLRREDAFALWVTHDAAQKQRVGTRHFLIEGTEVVEEGPP
jgi:ABC-type iron transport system FetAB ATPase subunit